MATREELEAARDKAKAIFEEIEAQLQSASMDTQKAQEAAREARAAKVRKFSEGIVHISDAEYAKREQELLSGE